ncbi:hypothetical protein BGZ96_002739 [Linnemannia gamsii]|uniref:Uncharacterized protein n=1 Tax=Linnemannia gamsii TaxID=64522 RepID=A0ABQ7K912_9FUNG|nr:hypothetical protein BGZ96_002739 [Linnemannia gamsii]
MALEDLLEMINKNTLEEDAEYTGEDEEDPIFTTEVDAIEEAANTGTAMTWEDFKWLGLESVFWTRLKFDKNWGALVGEDNDDMDYYDGLEDPI